MSTQQKQPSIYKQALINKIIKQAYHDTSKSFNLYCCQIWADVLIAKDLSQIQNIEIRSCRVADHDISILSKIKLIQLSSLSLMFNKFTGIGIRQLVLNSRPDGTNLANLKILNLNHNNIGNLGVKWLIKLSLYNLQQLTLSNHVNILIKCKIQTQGLIHIIKSNWPNIKKLSHSSPEWSPKSKMQLNGWLKLHENDWKKLQQFDIEQTQSISCMQFILTQFPVISGVFMNYNKIKIKNKSLFEIIKKILKVREKL